MLSRLFLRSSSMFTRSLVRPRDGSWNDAWNYMSTDEGKCPGASKQSKFSTQTATRTHFYHDPKVWLIFEILQMFSDHVEARHWLMKNGNLSQRWILRRTEKLTMKQESLRKKQDICVGKEKI